MTTKRKPFSSRNTTNNRRAQKRSAERRRCPKCQRKAALLRNTDVPGMTLYHCRWPDCDYERGVDHGVKS